jgi:hypothetical protein
MVEKLKTVEVLDKVSEETIEKELSVQENVMKEILEKQETEKIKNALTNPSTVALETTKHDSGYGITNVKKKVKELFDLYLTNQFVARAVNVRADTLISGGYKIQGEDENGVKACKELIEKSGDVNVFWELSVNSVTKDTPIMIKFPDGSIDIIEMSELYKDKEDSANIGRYSTQEIRDLQVMTDEGWKNIKYVFRHKINEDIYKIRTGTGLAKVTHDHSLISNGKEVHSKDFKIGSNIDVVDFDDSEIAYDYGNISKDLAWLYGFFVSDGTAGIYKTGKQWKITNTNRDFLDKALLIIQETYDKTAKIHWYGDIGHVVFSPQKNEEIFNWYLENCYTSNRFKRVPKVVLNSFKEIKEAFMEGYWAGDGAKLNSWNQSRYATDSFTLIAGIECLAKSLGKSISLNTVGNRENVYLIQLRDGFEDKQIAERIIELNSVFCAEFEKKKALSDEEIADLTDIPRRTISYYRVMNDIPGKYERQRQYEENNNIYTIFKDNHMDYLTKRKQDGIIEEIRTEKYNDYVYDIATENHKFVAGVGGLLHHNTDVAGDGFQEKIYNQAKTKIVRLKQVHPLTLEFKKDKETDKIIIDSKTKEPKGYVQHFQDKEGVEQEKDIPKDRIAHFKYNALGDEFTGMSLLQPGYDTIVRLMNMEYSAAEAAIKTANPLWVGKTNTKSPHQVAQWATILGKINGKDQIFIPDGMELEMKSPGQQNFNEYADYFLNAVIACCGVPKSVLLGGSDQHGNRAQDVVLSKHFYNLIQANQRSMEIYFNHIFEEYAQLAGFKAPKLVFEDIAEDAELLAESAMKLFQTGLVTRDEARAMIGLGASKETPKIKQSISDAVHQSDMETWHPAEAGSPAGSQAREKKAMKHSPV